MLGRWRSYTVQFNIAGFRCEDRAYLAGMFAALQYLYNALMARTRGSSHLTKSKPSFVIVTIWKYHSTSLMLASFLDGGCLVASERECVGGT